MSMRIVISEFMDEAAVQSLRPSFEVLYDATLVDRPAELIAALRDADALIVRNRTQVNQELLAGASRLLAVGRLGVGLDNIDQAYCASRGLVVLPAVGANAAAVAEYVISLAMALLRGFLFSSAAVAAGHWPRAGLASGREIAGKVLGLVGYGSVGQRVGELARAVGMRVLAYDPMLPASHAAWKHAARREELDDLCREADVVSLHVPYTPQNAGLLNARRLALMKPGAVLVNTARGGIVDEAALAAALRSGALAGAAVDVFAREPLPPGSALADVPNLFLTPHIAGVTHESNERVSALIAQRIAEVLRRA